ncbi:hypothetical protein, partial [Staphylococcus felis]
MRQNFKDILFIWLLMAILYAITIFSSFNLAYDKIQKLNISIEDNTIVTIVIVVSLLNFFLVLLQAIIFSIILYIINVITKNNLNKSDCLYIMSFALMINMLSIIPISLINLFFADTLMTTSNNIVYILLNPFLLLSLYVLYNFLKKRNVNKTMFIVSLIVYYM